MTRSSQSSVFHPGFPSDSKINVSQHEKFEAMRTTAHNEPMKSLNLPDSATWTNQLDMLLPDSEGSQILSDSERSLLETVIAELMVF